MEVVLRVYDLIETSGVLSSVGLGAYHTSITMNNREYDFSIDGIRIKQQYFSAGESLVNADGQVLATFKEEIILGYFEANVNELNSIIRNLREIFCPNSYNLVNRNCNHFTDAFAYELVQKNIPSYVNRMAWIGSWFCQDPLINAASKEEEENVAATKKPPKERPQLTEKQKAMLNKLKK